jgi:D-beta-D-heptose 7-phosphate kinase/D-beta-D-heptose 1-phosphate adenosyltransferase
MISGGELLSRGAAARRAAVLRAAGCRIVFTNGCFDIIHPGHLRVLEHAAALGDVLFVGLNSDDSVKRLKGPGRPVQKLEARARVLCALRFVDFVVPFSEDTPLELIRALLPDVLVKGGDYRREDVVGAGLVPEVVIVPTLQGHSTTSLLGG